MFGKNVKLITMVTAVAMALTIGSAAAMAQSLDTSGVTLVPGTGNTADSLMSRALKFFIEQGYDPADYDLQHATFDLDVDAAFIPKLESEWANRQFQFVGLIYIEEQFKVNSGSLQPGLHPLSISGESSTQPVWRIQNRINPRLHHEGVNFTVGAQAGVFCGKSIIYQVPDCVIGGGFSAGANVPVDPPSPPSSQQVGNALSKLVGDLFQGFCGATKGHPCD